MFLHNNRLLLFNPVKQKINVLLNLQKEQKKLTAGKAKKDIPSNAQAEAMSFPFQVVGTASPYPTVQRVI